MKLFPIIFGLIFFMLVGGFVYIASVDIPITQELVRQEIPAEIFQSQEQTP